MSSLAMSNCPVMPTIVAQNRACSKVSGGRTQTTSGSVQKLMLFRYSDPMVACMAVITPDQCVHTSPPVRMPSQ